MANVEIISNVKHQLRVARDEISNIRKQVNSLKCQNIFEVEKIKALLNVSKPFTCTAKIKKDPLPRKEDDMIYGFQPIGHVQSWYKAKNGTPRQSSVSQTNRATITINKEVFSNPEHALEGLTNFSHIWLLSYFHKDVKGRLNAKVHPPRLNGEAVGVLATRSPHRPSPIGLTLSKLDEIKGNILHISGVDLIEGTPILDIKPYIAEYDSLKCMKMPELLDDSSNTAYPLPTLKEPICIEAQWIHSPPVSQLTVLFTPRALNGLGRFHTRSDCAVNCNFCLSGFCSVPEARVAIADVLQADPRSVYRRNKCHDRLYYFTIDVVHVTCWFDDGEAIVEVLRIVPTFQEKSD